MIGFLVGMIILGALLFIANHGVIANSSSTIKCSQCAWDAKYHLSSIASRNTFCGRVWNFSEKYTNLSDCVHPCPCDFYDDTQKPCTGAPAVVKEYQKRIPGPLLDRIEVPRVDYEKLSGDRVGETSETLRARVQAARDIQNKRFGIQSLPTSAQSQETLHFIICNADMRVGEIRQFCKLSDDAQSLMR